MCNLLGVLDNFWPKKLNTTFYFNENLENIQFCQCLTSISFKIFCVFTKIFLRPPTVKICIIIQPVVHVLFSYEIIPFRSYSKLDLNKLKENPNFITSKLHKPKRWKKTIFWMDSKVSSENTNSHKPYFFKKRLLENDKKLIKTPHAHLCVIIVMHLIFTKTFKNICHCKESISNLLKKSKLYHMNCYSEGKKWAIGA